MNNFKARKSIFIHYIIIIQVYRNFHDAKHSKCVTDMVIIYTYCIRSC